MSLLITLVIFSYYFKLMLTDTVFVPRGFWIVDCFACSFFFFGMHFLVILQHLYTSIRLRFIVFFNFFLFLKLVWLHRVC